MFDAAVQRAYGGRRRIAWHEVLAGEKSKAKLDNWLPDETLQSISTHLVAIKGPLSTPVGGGFRSLNVTLRQQLDLYACVRPVRYFEGVPSPVKRPEDVNMVIFRENTEDIYAGIEYADGTPEAKKLIAFLQEQMGVKKIRFPESSGIGIKPISAEGTQRLVRSAIAVRHRARVHERHPGAQGQHHEVHRGRVPRLGLRAGEEEFGGTSSSTVAVAQAA